MLADVMLLNEAMQEIELLDFAEGDYTIGTSNTFELRVPKDASIKQGRYLMVDEYPEFGGVIDGIEIDTEEDYITATGRTWHGLLASNLIKPNSGQTHLIMSGDANEIIAAIIERIGLTECMIGQPTPSGYTITNYQFSRVSSRMNAYTGLRDMLSTINAKLRFTYDAARARIVVSAVARGIYIDDGLDEDQRNFVISEGRPINHLHCIGTGEGTERVRFDLYADTSGNVSTTQTIFGVAHHEEPYELSASEYDELMADGIERLKELQAYISGCKIVGLDDGFYDIDDTVGGVSSDYNVRVVTSVAEKIAALNDGEIVFTTKTETEV